MLPISGRFTGSGRRKDPWRSDLTMTKSGTALKFSAGNSRVVLAAKEDGSFRTGATNRPSPQPQPYAHYNQSPPATLVIVVAVAHAALTASTEVRHGCENGIPTGESSPVSSLFVHALILAARRHLDSLPPCYLCRPPPPCGPRRGPPVTPILGKIMPNPPSIYHAHTHIV